MKKISVILLAILACSVFTIHAQVLDDFACSHATDITNSTTATFTCNENHGFDTMPAVAVLAGLTPASLADKTVTIDSVVYTFKTSINNANAREVLIGASASACAYNLAQAINRVAAGAGTLYSTATASAHSTFAAFADENYATNTGGSLVIRARTAGLAGVGVAISAQSPMAWSSGNQTTSTRIWWYVLVKGGTGAWTGIGSNATPRHLKATRTAANQFITNANTTTYGDYTDASQNVEIIRASGAAQRMFDVPTDTYGDNIVSIPPLSHTLKVDTPICNDAQSNAATTEALEIECSRGHWDPDNQKAYGVWALIDSFVVAAGASPRTATITLTSAFNNSSAIAQGFQPLAEGSLFYIRGMQQYATSTNPGYDGTANDPAQTIARTMANNTDKPRGYRVWSTNGTTQFTIKTTLEAGTYLPTCIPASTCIWTGAAGGSRGYAGTSPNASPYITFNATDASGKRYPYYHTGYHVKGGAFDIDSNRFTVYLKFGVNNPRLSNGGYDMHWGTYAATRNQDADAYAGQSTHFYHFVHGSFYADSWTKIVFTGAPSHGVGAIGGGMNWPNEPTKNGWTYYPSFPGGYRGQMDAQTNWYIDPIATLGPWGGQTSYLGPPVMSKDTSLEPDEWISTRMISWSANRFLGPSFTSLTANPGYDVGFVTKATNPAVTFSCRYSTSATPLKTAGWSTGTDCGPISSLNSLFGSLGVAWLSPDMSLQSNFRAAFRPKVPIMGLTGSGVDIIVTTQGPIGAQAGDTVTVTGVTGNTAANQTNAEIQEVLPGKIFFRHVPTPGTPTVDGELVSVVASGGTCTLNTTVAHNLVAGRVGEVTGSTSSTLGTGGAVPPMVLAGGSVPPLGAGSSLFRIILTTPTSTSATFACTGVANGTYNTSQAGGHRLAFQVFPAYRLPGTGNGAPTIGTGTIEVTEENSGFVEIDYAPYNPLGGAPPTPPDAPSMFTATPDGENEIDLSWMDNADDETNQEIQSCTGSGCSNYGALTTLGADVEAYSHTNLAAGATHGYRLRACNTGGCSSWVTASATTDAGNPAPTAPSALSVVFRVDDRIIVGWTDNSDNETSFVLQIDDGGGFVDAATLSANVTQTTVLGLTANSSYSFRVNGVNAAGSSAWSSTLATSTLSTMPLSFPRLTSSGAVVRYKTLDGAACSILLPSGTITTDSGGSRNRDYPLLNLSPETSSNVGISCATIGGYATFTTPQAIGGSVTVPIKRPRPAGASAADNFVIYTGLTSDSLAFNKSIECTTPSCSTTLTVTPDAPTFIEVRWCLNRATDDSCATAANLKYKTTLGTVGLPPRPPTPPTP